MVRQRKTGHQSGLQTGVWSIALLMLGSFLALFPGRGVAQITPDETLGGEGSRVTRDVEVRGGRADRIDGGARREANLFHSFREFNVNDGQRVYFGNPSGVENILGRVTGNDVSDILGTLGVDGNASLFLLNPNGILFGRNARLDVRGSFTASTADGFSFADGAFFGANDTQSTSLLSVAVPLGLQLGSGAITNAGNLSVEQGQRLMLLGSDVMNTGQLTAPGGTVQVLGNRIGLLEGTRIDVSSATGGGTVLIGGDFRGGGAVPTANRTFVAPGATINADAIDSGNGGRVIVWANELTGFYGNISARGGQRSGNGGFVEVSGRQNLLFRGNVDLSAVNGLFGTLLLDPTDITIQGTGENDDEIRTDYQILQGDGGRNPFTISEATLEGLPGDATVILEAANDIRIEDLADGSLTFVPRTGAPGTGSITLRANADEIGGGNVEMANQGNTISTRGRDISISGASLTLGNIDTSLSASRGGKITLDATQGVLNVARLDTINRSTLGGGIEGADVIITASNGGINIIDVEARSVTINTPRDLIIAERLNARSDLSGSTAGNVSIGINGAVPSSVTVGRISTRNLENGNGGNVNIFTTGTLNVNGGYTRVDGTSIRPPQLVASSFSIGSEAAGDGGDININAAGGINIVGGIVSNSGLTGDGGRITLNSSNGTIAIGSATAGTIDSSAFSGNGGEISITARGNVTTPTAVLSRSVNGNGGNITLLSSNGEISTTNGTLNASSILTKGNGGNVQLRANGDIFSGSIESVGLRGGDISLRSGDRIVINNSDIASISRGATRGGDIQLRAGSIRLTDSRIGNIAFGDGRAGDINVRATDSISLIDAILGDLTFGAGRGGDINVRAGDRISIVNTDVDGVPNPDLFGELFQRFNVSFEIPSGSGIVTTTAGLGNAESGSAGNIDIDTDRLIIRNRAKNQENSDNLLERTGISTIALAGGGNSGNLRVRASDSISIRGNQSGQFNPPISLDVDNDDPQAVQDARNQSRRVRQQATSVATQINNLRTGITTATIGSGDAGRLTIDTQRLVVRDQAGITSGAGQAGSRLVRGNGRDLNITATDSVVLRGKAALATATFGTGRAGNLIVNSDQITLRDGALFGADTLKLGPAGSIRIRADRLNILTGSRIGAATLGRGQGGSIALGSSNNPIDLVQIEGTSTTNTNVRSGVFTDSLRNTNAGNITIDADRLNIQERGGINATSIGLGNAGTITLNIDTLNLQNQGQVSVVGLVSNPARNRGRAGNVIVNADDVRMESQSQITGITQSTTGGNITLNVANDLFMQNDGGDQETEITTSGVAGSDAGRIIIRADSVQGVLSENSDVIARTDRGQGGLVDIEARTIVTGFRNYEGDRTPESDFNAFSETNPGTRIIRGDNPEEPPADRPVVPRIDQVCPSSQGVTTREAGTSQFFNTGRGGLPPNPEEALNSNLIQVPWVTLDDNSESADSGDTPAETQPRTISEAQGWQRLPNGEVLFVSQTPTSLPGCVLGSQP